jgi:hypothetical protein
MADRGYYSIIQYCPDLSRAEAANVGVLLFCPELDYIGAHVSEGNDRIARFFGRSSFEANRVNDAKKAITNRLDTDRQRFRNLDDLNHFIETRGNDITLTPARTVRVVNPQEDLMTLFDELVGGRPVKDPRRRSALLPRLAQVFNQPSLRGKILRDERVVIPITGQILKAPYAFQNGTLNLVRPLVMNSRTLSEARSLAVDGDLMVKHASEMPRPAELVVALGAPGSDEQQEQREVVERLFKDYALKTYREEDLDGLEQYVTDATR